MNTKELKIEMLRHGDSGNTLSEALGMTSASFSKKINAKDAEFTQGEISAIVERYNLSAERLVEIFFAKEIS